MRHFIRVCNKFHKKNKKTRLLNFPNYIVSKLCIYLESVCVRGERVDKLLIFTIDQPNILLVIKGLSMNAHGHVNTGWSWRLRTLTLYGLISSHLALLISLHNTKSVSACPWKSAFEINEYLLCNTSLTDKSVNIKKYIANSQPKHMLWVLKRTVSLRRFFWASKTDVSTDR